MPASLQQHLTGSVRTMAFWLRRRATLEPDLLALTFGDATWRYGDLWSRIARMATVLQREGVGVGDRVGTLAANHPDILVTMFAASAIGAALVPLSVRLAARELEYIVADADLALLVADHVGAAMIEAQSEAPATAAWLAIGGPLAGWRDLDAEIASAEPVAAIHRGAADELAAIVYTSGTTGRPKGAMLTHRNLWSNDLNWLLSSEISRTDIAMITAPLFHVGGLFVLTTTTLMVGGQLVLLAGFDASAAIAAIERYGVTTSFGVPAMMLFMAQDPRFDSADLSSLRLYIAGGAPTPEPLLQRYAARGVPVSHCYGCSEGTSGFTFLEPHRGLAKLGSAGRPGLMTEIKLIDDGGALVETPGDKGEICARGGNITPGYWRNAEATAKAIDVHGWLRTGDIGMLDAEGFLTVCDRVKDMIISGGENVYPAEVESVLTDHPDISEAAVIGRADDQWGERVVAVVVPRADALLDLAEIQAFCNGRLARFKIPRELHQRTVLPLNGAGKIAKIVLRSEIIEGRA